MTCYLMKARSDLNHFTRYELIKISREENIRADMLSRLSSYGERPPRKVRLEVLDVLSIDEDEVMVECVHTTPSWMDEIITYLSDGNLLVEKVQARRFKRKSAWYVLNGDELIRRSFTLPYLKCLRELETGFAIQEVDIIVPPS